jgi:hypothetical protein
LLNPVQEDWPAHSVGGGQLCAQAVDLRAGSKSFGFLLLISPTWSHRPARSFAPADIGILIKRVGPMTLLMRLDAIPSASHVIGIADRAQLRGYASGAATHDGINPGERGFDGPPL